MRFLLALVGVTLMATSVLNLKENIMAWHTEIDDPIVTPAPVDGGEMTFGTPITEATLPPVGDGGTAPLESLRPVARPTAAPSESLRPVARPDVGNDTVALTGNVYRTGDRDAGPNGDIRAAQTALARLGTSVGEVDGVYGRNTSNAVQDAQELFGLPRTGVLDEATQDALDNLTDDQIAFFTSESEGTAAPATVPQEATPVAAAPATVPQEATPVAAEQETPTSLPSDNIVETSLSDNENNTTLSRESIESQVKDLVGTNIRAAGILGGFSKESGSNFDILEEDNRYSLTAAYGSWRAADVDAVLSTLPTDVANRLRQDYNNEVSTGGLASEADRILLGNAMFDSKYTGGSNYRGRGLIHITHEYNYKAVGDRIGVDLVANPELVNDPRYAVPAAMAYLDLNGYFDTDTEVTRDSLHNTINRYAGDSVKNARWNSSQAYLREWQGEADVETSPRPQERLAPNVDTAQVEAAETTEEVIETVAEAVPTELSQNPVEYIVENNLRGLDERNPLGAEAIRGFFRTATGSSLGAEAAWCAVFVDSVLRGIDAAPMARDQVSIFPDTRGTVGRAGPQRAREYENYGTGVELDDIKAGDLVILQGSNRGSGHIGFYTGERDENGRYLVLGGNQSSGGDGRTSEELSQLVAGVVGQESLTTRQLQQIVGATVDGAYGPATERNVRQYLRTQGIDNYAGGGSRGVSVNVSPYASSNFAAVRRIEDIQDLPVDVMKEVTASITGNAAGTR
jgi:peptidoglycan hydrolase-like protein with peptidoglycan-binding domain